MERILVVLSWEMDGIDRLPLTPRMVFPLKIDPLTQSATAEALILTVPPEVYPAGIETVPALVEISPLVEPLFAIEPVS